MPGFGGRWVRYAVGAVAFGVVAWAWHFGTRQSGGIAPVAERRVMPELVMAQLDGGTWRMTDHRGQVVLVNYWATWCGPCWEETPGLVRLSQSKGLAVVGVAIALPVKTAGTPFQREVWSELRKIACGTTVSYAQLAEQIGRPSAVRAVGLANGSNPIGVIVPCHRVIGSNGSLTGYGGGVERKRWLLEHEGKGQRFELKP
jgi:O-6-methylguanine DNA methyltransferase